MGNYETGEDVRHHQRRYQRNENAYEKCASSVLSKLPSFGKDLAASQQVGNPPTYVAIGVGANRWNNAKTINERMDDMHKLILQPGIDPELCRWPVDGCIVVVEWSVGPGVDMITKLISTLLKFGAISVAVIPKFVDLTKPAWLMINGEWIQQREMIRTYHKEAMQ